MHTLQNLVSASDFDGHPRCQDYSSLWPQCGNGDVAFVVRLFSGQHGQGTLPSLLFSAFLTHIFATGPYDHPGIHIINISKTWEKHVFATRIIAAVKNLNDVCVISARPYVQRAILKFAANTGAQAIASRFTPVTPRTTSRARSRSRA